ncbi:hypothetical protein GCM10029992_54560 [Glycomyces albus]
MPAAAQDAADQRADDVEFAPVGVDQHEPVDPESGGGADAFGEFGV